MKEYKLSKLRNLLLMGASGAGKTTLAEQIFHLTHTTNRLGKIDEGNTVMDFDAEEIAKKTSLSLSLGWLNYKDHKINILDTPGTPDFIGDAIVAIPAVENAVLVANAASGFEVGLELAIEHLENRKVGKVVVVNRMDNEHADFHKTLESIHENAGFNPIPVHLPIGRENTFEGVVDIIRQKAIRPSGEGEVPADMQSAVEDARLHLMEAVAETDEELLNAFLENMELSEEQLLKGLKNAVARGEVCPAFACSANTGVGVLALLDAVCSYLPSPEEANPMQVLMKGEPAEFIAKADGELLGYVFKLYADPNMGDYAYVRMFSGSLKSGMEFYIPEKDAKDKAGNMYYMLGKNRSDTQEIRAGEIGALVKLKNAKALNSIVAVGSDLSLPVPELPTPTYWQMIRAANQSDEDKISTSLQRVIAEDPTIGYELNPETHENVISGMGEQQLQLVLKKLKNRYKVEAIMKEPRIPYKETITASAESQYRHKKQSGGRGQYGEVYFRIKPTERGEGFEFINAIVGGVIPSNFIPAIEKGLVETMEKGIVAGYQVVDLSVEVYYGSYHDVDSSEMAFKIASSMALKEGFKKCRPILLEPIHDLTVIVPSEYMGDVMGDISTRRGRIMGMEQRGKKQYLNAQMPVAEMYFYYPALKSFTQGRGRFTQKFSHYEKVPDEIAAKVIAAWQDSEA
ncbi:MAG TPA: elongation factor G [Candidatus Syntrophosphaera sp.]|jgi:elongation factor G|nr:elongation factor G [Candidatus Cloacimonadota bacterium]OQB91916.1 MAG: Elongation factor G [Candidatus Cloacimonetes bacterium ADurb.Bin117]HOR02771.1 elongation factor G [Candidatus Syntrophosphaera sp.]HOG31184.1 elongation factor G [Candidatus Cloacimonadota bacterium]HOU72540.1 elongation factor G [Candidatus Syntrophosphaera sp.]